MPNAALKALLEGIIDYAGLFPPASLPLEEAIAHYATYLDSSDCWMLSRFVIPAGRLPDLSRMAGRYFPAGKTLVFAVLGKPARDWDGFFSTLLEAQDFIDAFRRKHGPAVQVDVFETPLPAPELDYQIRVDNLVNKAVNQLAQVGLFPFFEVPPGQDWQSRAQKTLAAISGGFRSQAGFKLRTGGVQADMVPTPARVAWALTAARDAGVRMKATAGLHHPVRFFDAGLGARMHGFLNVFGAGVLAKVHALDESALVEILTDEDPASFRFGTEGFSWRGLTVSSEAIAAFRRMDFVSFGSCSFDEPREDLQAIGLL